MFANPHRFKKQEVDELITQKAACGDSVRDLWRTADERLSNRTISAAARAAHFDSYAWSNSRTRFRSRNSSVKVRISSRSVLASDAAIEYIVTDGLDESELLM